MSTIALSLSALALAIVVLAPVLAHVAILAPLPAFRLWFIAVLPALAAILVALLALLLKRGPMSMNVATVAVALVPVLVVASIVRSARAVPRINDISTDLDDPPVFVRTTIPAYPEKFKTRVRAGYPDLASAIREGSKAQVFDRAVAAANELGWEVTTSDPAAGTFEAVSTSRLWNFRDDIVVRVREDGSKVRVDMRSRSRDGKGDFGANAKRIRAFLAKI